MIPGAVKTSVNANPVPNSICGQVWQYDLHFVTVMEKQNVNFFEEYSKYRVLYTSMVWVELIKLD